MQMPGINNRLINFESKLLYIGDIGGLVFNEAFERVLDCVKDTENKVKSELSVDVIVVYNWRLVDSNYISVDLYIFEKLI